MKLTDLLLVICSIGFLICIFKLGQEFPSNTAYVNDLKQTLLLEQDKVVRLNNELDSKRCEMRDYDFLKENRNFGVNGLYYVGKDFYTVWVKDRELSEIEETDKHEYCHYLIDHDYAHFCE